MKRVYSILLVLCIAIHASAMVPYKKFDKYVNQLPVELQTNCNAPKTIGKIVGDINRNGDIDQLYWLAETWVGIDIMAIEEAQLATYLAWEKNTISQIIRKDTLFIAIQDGRDIDRTFDSSFYARFPMQNRLIQAAQMLHTLGYFHRRSLILQTIPVSQKAVMQGICKEEDDIMIHYVERMLFGDDRYSRAHISPGPNEEVKAAIEALLGKEVIDDPTRLVEKVAALPTTQDQALVDLAEPLLIYEAHYVSSYDQNLVFQYIGAAATRLGVVTETLERMMEIARRIFPSQFEFRSEDMESLKTIVHNPTTDILPDFMQLQDRLRSQGYQFVDYPLFDAAPAEKDSLVWKEYLEQYLKVGYTFCKQVILGGGYRYLTQNADNVRNLLKIMGYYNPTYEDDIPWMDRFVFYLCELCESTQAWYYNTSDTWTIGAVMAENNLITDLIRSHNNDRLYMGVLTNVGFFHLALNNEEMAKALLEQYILPFLPHADICSRNKDWNCYYMWYYANVLPYAYLLYQGEVKDELGKFYSDRLLQAVRFNKNCDNNAHALASLVEYYYAVDQLDLAEELLEQYLALTGDSITYNGYVFAINYWGRNNYEAAARAADVANRYNEEFLAGLYSEHSLSPSRAYALAGRKESAMRQLELFTNYMRKEIGKQLMSIGASNAAQLMKRYEEINNRFVMLCEDTIASDMKEAYMRAFYDWQLQSKGLLLAVNSQTDSLLTHHPDAHIRDLHKRYLQRQKALTEITDMNSPEAITLQYNLYQAQNNLQNAIQEYIDKHGFEGVHQTTWRDVQAALQEGQVAIEIVNGKIGEDTIPVYYALLLRADSPAPTPIRLFTETDITPLIQTFDKGAIHSTYSFASRGKQLKELVWGQILPSIRPGEIVFFSPSGVLHQLAIEALPYDPTHTMGEIYNMVRLSSTREIIGGKKRMDYKRAALYGGIQYGATPIDLAVEHQKYRMLRNQAIDLPGTQIEVDTIQQLLQRQQIKVKLYQAKQATEESFKALSGTHPNIIHLATHGFYWEEKEAQQQKYFTQNSTIEDDVQQAMPIDPLDRCGLLFAGANTALAGHSARLDKGVQDGILTAKEISTLDLREADIVVLSACETGLGDISGDGVFGLQRAFKMAGAQTMLMALWKVDDDATRLLMTAFYRNYSNGQNKREAFRNAQLEVRNYTGSESDADDRAIASGKEKMKKKSAVSSQPSVVSDQQSAVSHPYASPYYWAGFILLD